VNTDLRPLGVGEILDRSLKLYLSNFGKIIGTAAAVVLMTVLVLGGIGLVAGGGIFLMGGVEAPDGSPDIVAIVLIAGGALAGMIVYMAGAGVLQGAIIHAVSDLYLGEVFEMKSVIRRAWGRAGAIIATWFLTGLAAFFGYLLCIVPGVIMIIAWSCAVPIVLLEGHGATDAMRRSWHLTKGRRWEILVIMILLWVVSTILSQLANCVGPAVAGVGGEPDAAAGILILVLTVSGMLVQLLVWPLYSIATTIIYYDLRVRKEAFDLHVLAREVGGGESLS
jgi:hypothetical protein